MARKTGRSGSTGGRLPRVGLVCAAIAWVALTAMPAPAVAGHGEPITVTGTANALIVDRMTMAKFSDINTGAVSMQASGDQTTVSLRPGGPRVADDAASGDANASFTMVFSLIGSPHQTFGISLPGAMVLSSGASTQSIRSFLHDAGPVPILGSGGVGRFNVGASLSGGWTDAKKTQVYISEIHVIVSNN